MEREMVKSSRLRVRPVVGILVLTAFLLTGGTAVAAEINVPADQPDIQAGIDAANPNDTVTVADGTYTGAGNVNLDFGGKAITVRSENGPDNCIIDCQNIDSTRGFIFQNGEGNDSVLDGFTIQNGSIPQGSFGGGILCSVSSSPVIRNCKILNNSAYNYGGGIYCRYGSCPVIEDCTISGNSTNGGGGGIRCWNNSSPTIRDCTITNNVSLGTASGDAGNGGGISCRGNSSPLIEGCTIENNRATGSDDNGNGGGISCRDGSQAVIKGCFIRGNTANVIGGGIRCHGASPQIINCTIENNTCSVADNGGGGINAYNSSSPTVTNCLIRGNEGAWGGGVSIDTNCFPQFTNCLIVGNNSTYNAGGIMAGWGSYPIFTNCTIADNTASQNGGGVYVYNRDGSTYTIVTLNNCIIWDNQAGTGGTGDGHQIFTFILSGGSSTASLRYCDYGNSAGDVGGNSLFEADANCIIVDPLFVGSGDYHPQEASPCVDAGNDSFVPPGVATDLDGNRRIMGDSVDIGAYEVNVDSPIVNVITPASPSDTPVTITYDLSDPQGDTCTVSFDYSVDSGTTWASCTAASGDTNPQASVTTPSTSLTFTWDASADLTAQVVDVMVRVGADDGDGHTGDDTTGEFTVIDLQPPSNFSGVGCATDRIEWTWTDAVGPSAYLLEDLGGSPVAIVAPGMERYVETVSGENTPATRLLRTCTSSIVELVVEPPGTVAGATLPWNMGGYHGQYLYTAAELSDTKGSLRKIYWQRLNSGAAATYDDVAVAVGHSTKTSLETNCADNFDVDGSTLVRDPAWYVVPVTSAWREWVEIPLDGNFYYNGASNLVIDIDVASGTDNVAWSEVISTAGDTSLYGNPGSPVGTPWDRKFLIKFGIEAIRSTSDPATASAYTLVHDAADDDLLLDLSVSGTEVVITITEPPNEHAGLTGVKIERATNDTFTQDATSLQDFADNYSYTDADVTGGTRYWYRITFCNGDGTASAESPGESVTVLGPDCAPVAEITAPSSGTHAATILIDYDLRDYDSDPAEIAAHFSLDSGATWTTCTLAPGGDGTTPLATSLAGTSHIYAWDSDADGAGATTAELVQLRITPSDDDGVGSDDITSFTVNNAPQRPPVVAITDPTTGIHGDDITIAYTLTDVNADDCDMTIEYSQDGGSSWDPCTAGTGGDGMTGLDAGTSGTSHTFVWASRTDLPDIFMNVTVQVIADDGQAAGGGGAGNDTAAFSVDNSARISAHFAGSPVSGTAPVTVWFSDLSVGNITSWLWDFGESSTSTDQNPDHRYASPGTYTISLTVTGPAGSDTETRTGYVNVTSPPAPSRDKGGCSCTVDRTPTPPGELLGYFLPAMLIACAYLALRKQRP